MLRQFPHNVIEWEKRVALWGDNKKEVVQTYTDAIAAINPKKALGKFHELWTNYAKLSVPGVLRIEIDEGTITSSLSPDLQYACRYWVSHLKQSQHNIIDGDTTHIFLQKHLLHWLELKSLMRESSQCVHLLDSLQVITGVGSKHTSSLVLC
jgi:hypothetical protein